MKRLYPSHVATSGAQKAVLGLCAAGLGFVQPRHTQAVATLGETTGAHALARMRERMRATQEGRKVLRNRPSFKTDVVVDHLARTCPPESLGARFAHFMSSNNLSSADRADVRFVDDEELAYVMKRYREVHDIWHVLLGFESVSVESEIGLKWAELAATGLPMAALASAIGPLRVSPRHWPVLATEIGPWVLRNMVPLSNLITVYYEEHMEKNLIEFRKELGFVGIKS